MGGGVLGIVTLGVVSAVLLVYLLFRWLARDRFKAAAANVERSKTDCKQGLCDNNKTNRWWQCDFAAMVNCDLVVGDVTPCPFDAAVYVEGYPLWI